MQDSLNPGDRAFLRGQDTPYVCRVARANHQLSLLGVTRCSAQWFCEHCAAQEMEVWNLLEPHLSSLPSPLPLDRTVPFSAPLPPKGLGLQHTWELSGGYDTVPLWIGDLRGSSEGQRPPGWVHPQPSPPSPLTGCSLHLSPPPHPKLFPPGEGLRDKVTNSSGRSHQIRHACPACEPVFSPHSLPPEAAQCPPPSPHCPQAPL